MPSNLERVLSDMKQSLSPLDAQLFDEAASVIIAMGPLEISRYVSQGTERFPQLDTGVKTVNERLAIVGIEMSIQHSEEAMVSHDPDTPGAKRIKLLESEKAEAEQLDAIFRQVEDTLGGEYRAANTNLLEAQRALSAARTQEQYDAANGAVGSAQQLKSKNAVIVAENAVRNCANEDRRLHKVYADACRSLRPAGPIGGVLAPEGAPEPAKPPPV